MPSDPLQIDSIGKHLTAPYTISRIDSVDQLAALWRGRIQCMFRAKNSKRLESVTRNMRANISYSDRTQVKPTWRRARAVINNTTCVVVAFGAYCVCVVPLYKEHSYVCGTCTIELIMLAGGMHHTGETYLLFLQFRLSAS